jgi:hypothetical protein
MAGAWGAALPADPVWQLYLLSRTAVERFLAEAHQEHLLHYSAAGSVVRLEFPADTLEGYAHALAERAHRMA